MDGVAPTTRAKALTNFVTAWGSLAGMTLVYNMLKGEDEEFKKLDPKLRDRAVYYRGRWLSPNTAS
jgi:hypothetical protein